MRDNGGGPRDLTRAMRLLWRAGTLPRRGPKPTFTVERIVRAAVEIADRDGLAALSMRVVADRVGAGTMSLYTYVPGKAELIALMLDSVDAEGTLPHTVSGLWREKTESWAREDWALYHRHEWMLDVSTRYPLGPNTIRRYDSALRSLAGTGLPEGEIVAATEVVDSYVRGMARRSVEGLRLERRTGTSEQQWWAGNEPLLEEYVDAEEFPAVRRVWAAGAFASEADSFEFGLQRMLDGIQVRIEEHGEHGEH
ncbi:TetR/AcrR family transcriptional regulator [Qaidamihabitans albus]|uniref:TetR/AcrR family transcriptional regulator n=1 Tax=Qaidamihabitans albus TaxID=2795733 RepID=UPI0018F2563B|nr:TetR/AcrR family transcriptional regulator [Qaidamihabitans albus]